MVKASNIKYLFIYTSVGELFDIVPYTDSLEVVDEALISLLELWPTGGEIVSGSSSPTTI